mgnify:CR=1 FL=1
MFEHVDAYAGDPILTLNENFQKDPRADKINLSIGIYFDDDGRILDQVVLHQRRKREEEQRPGQQAGDLGSLQAVLLLVRLAQRVAHHRHQHGVVEGVPDREQGDARSGLLLGGLLDDLGLAGRVDVDAGQLGGQPFDLGGGGLDDGGRRVVVLGGDELCGAAR